MSRPSTKKEPAASEVQAVTQQSEAVSPDSAVKQPTEKAAATSAKYSIEELAAAPALFGDKVSPDCVAAALRMQKADRFTKADAVKHVNAYRKKEVK